MMHVLFLGARSGCRSHMAAGFARAVAGDEVEVSSVDIEAVAIHPQTVAVMGEVGIDVSDEPVVALRDIDIGAVDLVVCLTREYLFPRAVRRLISLIGSMMSEM